MKKTITMPLIYLILITLIIPGVSAVNTDNWPMFHHDQSRTGYSSSQAPNTATIIWNTTITSVVNSSPVFGKGRLFIGSEDGKLYFFDADPSDGVDEGLTDPSGSSADLILTFSTDAPIRSSPLYYNGKVYFGSMNGKVYCIYACIGARIWEYNTSGAVTSSPVIGNNRIYIGSYDGKLYCIDAETGEHIWDYQTDGAVSSSPAYNDNKVYFSSHDSYVYCLYASNGTLIWRYRTSDAVQSSPVVTDDKVIVGSNDGNVYCLYKRNGSASWIYNTNGNAPVRSSAAVAYDKVFVGSDNGDLYCLYLSNGSLSWSYNTSGEIVSSPAIADGKVYFGSHDGSIYCLNASDGGYLWGFSSGAVVSSSPAVVNQRLYCADENGNLYCFRNLRSPYTPSIINGPVEGILGTEYEFSTRTSDPEDDAIYYMFDWGDGKNTSWIGPFNQSERVKATHKWSVEGYYHIRVKARDSYGCESEWSEPLTIHIQILSIKTIRGGLGLHITIKNLGSRKVWNIGYNVTVVGGYIINLANEGFKGEILNIDAGGEESILIGPFFQLGRVKIIVNIKDRDNTNNVSSEVYAFTLGFLIFCANPNPYV